MLINAEQFPVMQQGVETPAWPDPATPGSPRRSVRFVDNTGVRRRAFLSESVDAVAFSVQLMMLPGVADVVRDPQT